MAVYRHILVIPPTAKVLPPKNEKLSTAKKLPPYCITTERIPPYFGFTASAKKVPRTLDTAKKYRQLSKPPKEYRQLSIQPKLYRQHWISPKRYRRHWRPPKTFPPMLDTAQKNRHFFSCSFFVLSGSSGSFSAEPLCGRVDTETPPHLPIHLPSLLPPHLLNSIHD